MGVDGILVRFAGALNEPANRAALAFRAAVDRAGWSEVIETSSSLVSVYVRFDPHGVAHTAMAERLAGLLGAQDWFHAALPGGRRLVTIPTAYGSTLAPQLEEAATAAGVTPQEAIAQMSGTQVRVQTIGFAPGQPYLGALPDNWDIPRQTGLTPQVPAGALVVALRQFVLFSVAMPTGWRHVGQTAAPLFRPEADDPFLLRPGDEVRFDAVTPEAFDQLKRDPMGGVTLRGIA